MIGVHDEHVYTCDNKKVTFKVGLDPRANDSLIKIAKEEDWLFHLADYPSRHCLVEIEEISSKGEDLKLEKFDIETASNYLKDENFELKISGSFNKTQKVHYLQKKFVKSGEEKGQVILLKEPEIFYI